MEERFAAAGAIELCYESIGDPADPTLLLIMGLGTQMISWPDGFLRLLVDRGFHVVRFDNRDVGRSSHMTGTPSAWQLLRRDPRAAAYTLDDMAADAAGLLDALGIDAAHVAGASMGGMIAQVMAVRHPQRVLSLASIMSTTGARRKGRPALRVYRYMAGRPARTIDDAVARRIKVMRFAGSPSFHRDEAELRRSTAAAWERDPDKTGTRRQMAAVNAAGDRTAELAQITAPTVVIHGELDRMCDPSGGRATAAAIPGARFELIDGMGHDLPPHAWERIAGLIAANAGRA